MRKKCQAPGDLTKKHKFIISQGKYKGLGLFLESNDTTRPTKALIKKSFFDTMRYELFGKTFIECFAGSGQMGFEALSLGVSEVVFFEKNMQAFKNLCNNITLFWEKHKNYHEHKFYINSCDVDMRTHTPLIKAHFKDFLQSQDLLINFTNSADFQVKNDIIPTFSSVSQLSSIILYMDPPFACRVGFDDVYARICCFIESFQEDLIQKVDTIVIESMSNADFGTQIGAFYLTKKSKFGQTALMYFTRK